MYLLIKEKTKKLSYRKWQIRSNRFLLFCKQLWYAPFILGPMQSFSLTIVIIVVVIVSPECGEVLTEETGTIESPGFPKIYPSGINCTWHIVVQQGKVIRLEFNTFYLDFHYNCTNDYLQVDDTVAQISLGRWECLVVYAELWSMAYRFFCT